MPAQIVVKTLEAPLQSDGDPTHRPGANLGRWLVELQPILNDLGFYYMRENLDFVEPSKFLWTIDIGTFPVTSCDRRVFFSIIS